ncbi:hypothetical protein SAMN05421866_0050 [Chryseobacterium oranimense]|uniref:Uncharacterized protein n=1 Tax=Chryseobacterium oranimense TaxID=421058 RepID=A0A1M5X8C3_9FLAO|nr:hypothetical protein [Chryseobacterium oranimense]SHH96049.1 hypothetical protein SAMN05421866_0050 [Chryseobacterium oranimense]
MKNMINKIDKLLKEDENLPPKLKAELEKKKKILSNDKAVKK